LTNERLDDRAPHVAEELLAPAFIGDLVAVDEHCSEGHGEIARALAGPIPSSRAREQNTRNRAEC
jgi:hypothetical protein